MRSAFGKCTHMGNCASKKLVRAKKPTKHLPTLVIHDFKLECSTLPSFYEDHDKQNQSRTKSFKWRKHSYKCIPVISCPGHIVLRLDPMYSRVSPVAPGLCYFRTRNTIGLRKRFTRPTLERIIVMVNILRLSDHVRFH